MMTYKERERLADREIEKLLESVDYSRLSPAERDELEALLNASPIFGDPTFPEQERYLQDKSRFKALLCSRRSGKSTAAAYELLGAAWETPGCSVLYVGLTRETAKRIMVKDALFPVAKKLGIAFTYDKTELSLTLANGSIIYLVGLDADEKQMRKVFGQKFKLAIADEAALYTVNLRDLVYSILKPAVVDYAGTIVLMGMPSVMPAGIFYEITKLQDPSKPGVDKYLDTLNGVEWSVHRWTAHENPYVREEWDKDIAAMVAVNPDIVNAPAFKREYYGQWGEVGEAFFGPNPGTYNKLPAGLVSYAIGLDLAYSEKKASDWSIAVVLGEFNGWWYVVEVLRRKKKATDFAVELRELQKRYKKAPTRTYGSTTEKGVVDFLNEVGCAVSYQLAKGKKYQRAIPVSAAWGAKRILVPAAGAPWLAAFLETLGAFTGIESPRVHDDDVDALAAAFDLLPSSPIKPRPKYGTPEYWAAEEEALCEPDEEFHPFNDGAFARRRDRGAAAGAARERRDALRARRPEDRPRAGAGCACPDRGCGGGRRRELQLRGSPLAA